MSANRLRIALTLIATIVVALSPSGVGRGQEASPPPVADPAAAPAALDPPAIAADPATAAASKRPVVRKGDGWHPIMIVPANDDDLDDTIVKLNAAGFDAIKVPGSNWIPTAPRPNQTEAESVPQLRALLGKDAFINPPSDGPRKTNSPHSFTCVKWTPKESGDETQEADLNRVVTALADSGLPFEVIDHDQRRDGSNYIFAIHSADSETEVEALIRRLVQNPTLWPAQSINVHRKPTDEGTPPADPQPIDGSLKPESDPNATPPLVPTLDPPPAADPPAPVDPAAVTPDPIVPGTIPPPAITPADPSLTPPATADLKPIELLPNPAGSNPYATPLLVPTLNPLPSIDPAAPVDPAVVAEDPIVPGTIPPPAFVPADPSLTPPVNPAVVAEDPAAPSATLPPPALAPDSPAPIGQAERPRQMLSPWRFEVQLHPSFERGSIQETLEAEGFDVRELGKRGDGSSTWSVAPPSEADLEQSDRRLREALGRGAAVSLRGFPRGKIHPRLAQTLLSTPKKPWFFKWTPSETDQAKQTAEWSRVAAAIAKPNSKVDIQFSAAQDPDGDWYVSVNSSATDIPKIEELVRTVVKEPKFWRPPQLENYFAQHVEAEVVAAPSASLDPRSSGDPLTVASDPSIVSEQPTPPPADAPQSPSLAAKMLLIETDWTKANDPEAAERLARSTLAQVFDLNRAGEALFRPGYAALFNRDEARNIEADMQKLGLVRQTLSASPLDLKLADKSIDVLGGIEVAFSELGSDGIRRQVEWNLLVLTQDLPHRPMAEDPFGPQTAPPAEAYRGYRAAIVGWPSRKEPASSPPAGAPPAENEAERYVGSFILRSDQSAIVPLALPGVEGLTVVISAAHKGTIVRSLGPRGHTITQQALTTEMTIDWDDLIRAYEASPMGQPSVTAPPVVDAASPPEGASLTVHWRPASEDQLDLVENAVLKRYPQIRILSRQFEGPRGASLSFAASEDAAQEIEQAVVAILPEGATLQLAISKAPLQEKEPQAHEEERTTLIFRLENSASDEVVTTLNALKLDPSIRLVSDARTNSILLSAPDPTKYQHVQAVVDLLRELDQPAEETPAVQTDAPQAQPNRGPNAAKLRSDLELIEGDVQTAAASARAASEAERAKKLDDLRQVVAEAFELRLKLQREEAAELRDRLAKIEENLERRERIQAAVIERRIEVLLDPALEWPDVALEESSTSPVVAASSQTAVDPTGRNANEGVPIQQEAPDLQSRGDAFSAATSLAIEIGKLTDQALAIESSGSPDGSEMRLALIRRQLDLLQQEFDARQQALRLELAALQAKLNGAQASYERIRTLIDTGAVSQEESQKVEAEMQAAQADVARLEVLLQQYDWARASLPGAMAAESESSKTGDGDLSPVETDPASLQGTWRIVRYSISNGPLSNFKETVTWQFDGEKLIHSQRPKPDWLNPTTLTIEHSPQTPGVFLQQGEKDDAPILQGRFEVRGDSLRVAVRHDRFPPGPPKQVAPAESVDYYELERIAEDDESARDGATSMPAGSPSGSTAASSLPVSSAIAGDQGVLTALVLRVADLHLEIRRLQSQDPVPPHRDLAIEMLMDQIERLRKDLDVRQSTVRERRPDAASKFAVAQAHFDRAQRLSAQNLNASQELVASEAELASAREALDQIDASIAAYDEGRKFMDEAAKSEKLPADFADDANGRALRKLQGFWISVEECGANRFGTSRPEFARLWLFAGNAMIDRALSFGAGSLGDVKVVADDDSGGDLTFVFDGLPEYAGVTAYVFRFDGDVLKVAKKEHADVSEAAPQPGVQYYAFARSDAVESLIAAFDADAVDTEAIKNAGIDLAITYQEEQRRGAEELASGTKSFDAPVLNARHNLRSLAQRLESARDAWERSADPDLTQEERRRLRSQSLGLRAEWDDERDHFFAQKFYVERALANVRTRIESETSEEERDKLSTTEAKLIESLATVDELARIARLPSPVSLGRSAEESWRPLVNAEQRAFQLDLPLEVHANELRTCEERIVDPAYDDSAREREVARRDYLKEGAREIRRLFAAAVSGAASDLDRARTELNQAKRGQGLYGESLDDVDREFTIAREEYRLERTTLAVDDFGSRLKEVEAAFPFLLEEPVEVVPANKAVGRPPAASLSPADGSKLAR